MSDETLFATFATKKELIAVKNELKEDIALVKKELKQEIEDLAIMTHRGFEEIKGEMREFRDEMKEMRIEMREGFSRLSEEKVSRSEHDHLVGRVVVLEEKSA